MNILLVTPYFYPAVNYGGPIFSTLHAYSELSKLNNFNIYVSTTNANCDKKLDIESNVWINDIAGLNVKYYNETILNYFSLSLFLNLWRDILRADVVHVQPIFNLSTIFSLLYSLLLRKPVLLSPRGSLGEWCLLQGSRLKRIWLNLLIKPLTRSIMWHATSKQEENEILNLFPKASVTIIPNGVDFSKYLKSNTLTKAYFLKHYANFDGDADKIIVSMGRVHKKKGFDILIDSFTKVLIKFPLAKLLIAGEDEGELAILLEKVNSLKLSESVFFIGSVSGQEKIDFLANADLFVLSSHNENFGNVYVESLAAGTPIVASKNTPWSEVEGADCGRWVVNSVSATSVAIIDLLSKDRNLLRVNAQALAKKYDWLNISIGFKNIFDCISK
ncbi:glycosyltransferase [Aeromonas veronii]